MRHPVRFSCRPAIRSSPECRPVCSCRGFYAGSAGCTGLGYVDLRTRVHLASLSGDEGGGVVSTPTGRLNRADIDCLHKVGCACGHRPVISRRPGRTGSDMAWPAARERVVYPLQKRVINPIVMLAHELGVPPPGDALLETTGVRRGAPGGPGAPRCAPAWTGRSSGWWPSAGAALTGSGTSRPIPGSGSRCAPGPVSCGGPVLRASWTLTTRVSGGG